MAAGRNAAPACQRPQNRLTWAPRRDICAVTAAARPPTGPAQALLDLLAADINIRSS
jgi:hypothetical protein